MPSVKFVKGSEEWLMFQDFYNLVQSVYEPVDSREYWDELFDKVTKFVAKYNNHGLACELGYAIADYVDKKIRKIY